jgi:hypothetical protein
MHKTGFHTHEPVGSKWSPKKTTREHSHILHRLEPCRPLELTQVQDVDRIRLAFTICGVIIWSDLLDLMRTVMLYAPPLLENLAGLLVYPKDRGRSCTSIAAKSVLSVAFECLQANAISEPSPISIF